MRSQALILSAVLLMVPGTALGISPAKRALIGELMRASKANVLSHEFLVQMMSLGGAGGLTPERIDQLKADIVADVEAKNPIDQSIAELFDRTFSEAQLRQAIAFFRTEAGKRYADVQVLLATEGRAKLADALSATLTTELERSKVLRTMSNMRAISSAVEAFAVDSNAYPKAKNLDELVKLITPVYIRDFPRRDGWEKNFYYVSADPSHHRIVSGGPDGRIDATSLRPKSKPKPGIDDLIFEHGEFLRDPLARKP